MPRLTAENREARRADILAAARSCFSRDGFHQTSMPDIAAEAGVSAGAPYRYFTSKEEIIIEVASDAFHFVTDPIDILVASGEPVDLADMVAASIAPVVGAPQLDAAGHVIPTDERLRCAIQAWSELLRHDGLRDRAIEGFDRVRHEMAVALGHARAVGMVPAEVDIERAARVVMALVHGFLLQKVAFGLEDVTGFVDDVRAVLGGTGRFSTPTPRLNGIADGD